MPGSSRVRRSPMIRRAISTPRCSCATLIEISAIILVAKVVFSLVAGVAGGAITAGAMIIVSYDLLGRRASHPRPAARRPGRLRVRRTDRRDHHRARARSRGC